MQFKVEYTGLYVTDLEETVAFFEKAFGLEVLREKVGSDRRIAFMGNDGSPHRIEIIQMNEGPERYDVGDRSMRLAFRVDDFDAAHALHEEMGCIYEELPEYGVYFCASPDGYLCEVMPTRK